MALINIKHQKVLAILKENLLECIKNDLFVNVHIHIDTLEISHCVIPDDIIIEDYIMITQGNFQLSINLENIIEFDIEYIEAENSYAIHCDNINIYFDFN